jgi:IclR family transcriptional regulator, pca regulon regulatory protein
MGQSPAQRTIAEVAQAAGLPRTAARRFLATLTELGFVKVDGKHYWLTPKVLRLGLSFLYTLPYWRHAQVALEELGAAIGQSCAISVLDGEDIVYVQRLHTKRILPTSPSLGSRLPAHAISMGRVLLSGLSDAELDGYLATATLKKLTAHTVTDPRRLRAAIVRARREGHAWVDGELDEAICGLAVPVRDREGAIGAAINVSLLRGTFDEEAAVAAFLPALRQAASRLRSAAG